jgi:hypothetical protein
MHEFSLGIGVHLWDCAITQVDPLYGISSKKKTSYQVVIITFNF